MSERATKNSGKRKIAEKKNTTSAKKKTSSAKKGTTAASFGRANAGGEKKSTEQMNAYHDRRAFKTGIIIAVMVLLSVFLYLCYFRLAGSFGTVIGGAVFGFFGWFAWIFPLSCVIGYVFWLVNRGDRRVWRRILSFIGMALSLLGFTEAAFGREIITEYYTTNRVMHKGFECLSMTCTDVLSKGKFSAGLLGRWVGTVFSAIIGRIAAAVILLVLFLICLYIFYGIEMMGAIRKRNAYQKKMEEMSAKAQDEEDFEEPSYRLFPQKNAEKESQKKELEKAPKVQSFHLQGAENTGRPKDSAEEKEEKADEKKKEEKTDPLTDRAEKTPSESAPKKEQEIFDSGETDIDDRIPVYRNEMKKKFGNKKSFAQSESAAAETAQEKMTSDKKNACGDDSLEPTRYEKGEEAYLLGIDEDEDFGDGNSGFLSPNEDDTAAEKNSEKNQEKDFSDSAREDRESLTAKSGFFSDGETGKGKEKTSVAKNAAREISALPAAAAAAATAATAAAAGVLAAKKNGEQKEDEYQFPPISLLSVPKAAQTAVSDEKLRETAEKLKNTLGSFGVEVAMGSVTCGPTVTRYEVLPAQGVRVNKITNLADDLKLALAAPSIRIEAPIPGKAAVGIEVPNPVPGSVYFRELLEGDEFLRSKSNLTFAVGKDIAGKLILTDITKMPHLLIAGATGSGKSVCINTLIMSILYKAKPEDVKLIMIDPKVVELSVYNGIPHLFCPVVTDPKQAALSLNWAVREMMERYNKFKEFGVRNISGYNKKLREDPEMSGDGAQKMPYLVVIVDEFADLMMVAAKEVEDSICRLAQLARAAGIHLVLATQRPSVNVITGVIKANIPSRIAFSVSSAVDSRTIIDKGGAEKLLGKGDMLFFPSGYSEPVRVQGAFVSDQEVSDVVDFLRQNNASPDYDDSVTQEVDEMAPEEGKNEKPEVDEYFAEAGRFVIESDRAAAGQLQRRFSIGFNRAGRIIDQLNQAGVVGPAEGTKPRRVLMSREEFEQMIAGDSMPLAQGEPDSAPEEQFAWEDEDEDEADF